MFYNVKLLIQKFSKKNKSLTVLKFSTLKFKHLHHNIMYISVQRPAKFDRPDYNTLNKSPKQPLAVFADGLFLITVKE